MDLSKSIKEIRSKWLDLSIQSLSHFGTERKAIRGLLERFYDQLEAACLLDNPAELDLILEDWARSLPQSNLESSASDLLVILKDLARSMMRVLRDLPDPTETIFLMERLIPYFLYAYEKGAQIEMEVKISHLKDQLEQTRQTLAAMDRSKSDFVSISAHELRTPLTLVEGYASMLREALEKNGIHPHQAILLDGIQNGSHRLRSIINDIIDVSLIDNDLLNMNFQPVWVNRLLTVLENEFRATIDERKLRLEILPFPGANEMTFADPERLLQVFRNVLANAIKYTPDGGRIIVAGRKLPGFLEVTFQDTGIGIDPEVTQVIFEKFTRLENPMLHSSSKTRFKGGGPGLGLHIAKGIIEAHGGAIWAESEKHDEVTCPGSTFHVMIPIRLDPTEPRMAKLFSSLTQNQTTQEVNH